MRLIHLIILVFLLLPHYAMSQKVDWVMKFPKAYGGQIEIKTDHEGNIYLVNAHPSTTNSGSITKMNSEGNVIWDINFYYPAGQSDQVMKFILDPAGNFYGILVFAGNDGFDMPAKNGTFRVGKNPEGANYSRYDEKVLTFKLNKDGEYQWSTLFNSYNYHIYNADLRFDPSTNTLYHLSAYSFYLQSANTTLNTPATSDKDLVPVVFFCSLDAVTGEEQVLNNMYIGEAGTLIPQNDRLSYFYSNTITSNWQRLTQQGKVIEHKTLEPDIFAKAELNGPFLIQSGNGRYHDPVYGGYDPHNRIRISDLYGDVVVEKEFSFWNELYQQKDEVFGNFGLQSVNENTLIALISGAWANFDTDKSQFDGETITERDFRFLFFDRALNITKKLPASSSGRMFLSSLLYCKVDRALYVFLESRIKNSFTIGGTVIDIPPSRNYVLIKLRMDELSAAPEQANVLSFLVDGQLKTANIDQANKLVTAYVGPGTDLASLNPRLYVSDAAKLKQTLSPSIDFSEPQRITLVSGSGTEQEWTLQVNKTYGKGNSVEHVMFPGQRHAQIDSLHRRVEVVVSSNVDPGNLSVTDFKVSDFATASPDPFQLSDFSQPLQLLITAEDGEKAVWSLQVIRSLSWEKKIVDFRLQDQIGISKINDIDRIVEVNLAQYADWEQRIEHFVLSPGARILAPGNKVHDFSKEIKLIVEAEDGTQADWTLRAKKIGASTLAEALKAYPIPTGSTLFIDLTFLEKAPATIELLSTDGRTMLRQRIFPEPRSRTVLNISNVEPGLYLLKLTHANQVHTQKIVIQH